MLRVVLDANVIVSGVIAPRGAPARILEAWRTGWFQPLVSPAILDEIGRVLRYPRIVSYHRWPDDHIRTFLEDLAYLAIPVEGELEITAIQQDPTDNRYLECAVEGRADYIVSGDQHVLALGEYEGIPIHSPRAFIEVLEERPQS